MMLDLSETRNEVQHDKEVSEENFKRGTWRRIKALG
jgi:hypothetical protein